MPFFSLQRKEHVLLFWGQFHTGVFCCILNFFCSLFFFPHNFVSFLQKHTEKHPLMSAFDCLPPTLHMLESVHSVLVEDDQLLGFRSHLLSGSVLKRLPYSVCSQKHYDQLHKGKIQSLFELNLLTASPCRKHKRMCANSFQAQIPCTTLFFFSCVTLVSSVNQFCHGGYIQLPVPSILDGKK